MNHTNIRRGNTQIVAKNQVILNLIQDLQRLPLSFINSVRGRCQIKFGMTTLLNNDGFTLIELLVVVLIIGILAAVALPQYQKTVAQSQAMQGLVLLKSLVDKAEMYYLEHGEYPPTLDALDPQLPSDWIGTKKIYTPENNGAISNQEWSIVMQNLTLHGMHIGQLKGSYQGAGFSYAFNTLTNNHGTIPQREFLCSEFAVRSDAPFKKHKGDFCEKLFKGNKLYDAFDSGYEAYYRMK